LEFRDSSFFSNEILIKFEDEQLFIMNSHSCDPNSSLIIAKPLRIVANASNICATQMNTNGSKFRHNLMRESLSPIFAWQHPNNASNDSAAHPSDQQEKRLF